jgi:hypothetical protein
MAKEKIQAVLKYIYKYWVSLRMPAILRLLATELVVEKPGTIRL